MEREELAAWLRLALTARIGGATARRLLAAFGLPQQIFEQPDAALGVLLDAAQLRELRAAPPDLEAHVDRTLAWLAEAPGRRRVCTLGDPDYPATPVLDYFLTKVFG